MVARAVAVAFAALAGLASTAVAQTYPARPVTIVVPHTDLIARDLARRLEARLGQSFVIEQKFSGVDARYVARASPDGYTILLGTSTTMAIDVSVYKNLPYDPTKDLVPIALVAGVPFVLVVNPSLPIRSIDDLVRAAKSTPDGLTSASNASNGAERAAYLFAELLKGRLGIKLTRVPYKELERALNDIVGGHLHTMFTDFATALPLVRDGKLRAIGVSTAARVGSAPEIPPLTEVGMPGFDASWWQMMVAPAGIPQPVLALLNSELRAIMGEASVQKAFADRGLVPFTSGPPDELQRFVKSEIVRWGEVAKRAGMAGKQ